MGKGGESNEVQRKDNNDVLLRKAGKLGSLTVEDLKGWAKAYGIPDMTNPTKEALCLSLVITDQSV
jgi:hypothetical protein